MKGAFSMKNKKILLAAVTIATLSLAACNNGANRAGYNDRAGRIDGYHRSDRADDNNGYRDRINRTDNYYYTSNSSNSADNNDGYNSRAGRRASYHHTSSNYRNSRDNNNGYNNRTTTDTHLSFVSDYGFNNVSNVNGTSSYNRYRLDATNATNDDIFHSWRHAWVDPNDYMGKDIDVYRYQGDFDGGRRTIHILSHNGNPIGGYHYGHGETSEHGVMLKRDGFTSRGINDFRGIWNGMFDIRG